MEFIASNFVPLMFTGLLVFLLMGFPVAFSLAATGLFFGFIGMEVGLFPSNLFQALPLRVFGIMQNDTLLAIPFFTFMGIIRMMPMKVKNGMASKVSFCMMPNTRSGRAWNRLDGKRPTSMPMKPKNSPVAASENATGKPMSRNTSKPVNMRGTKLDAMNSMIWLSYCAALRRCCSSSSSCWARSSSSLGPSWASTSGPLPVRKAMRLISSLRLCSASRAKPAGIRA